MTAIGFQDWALLPGEAKLRAAVREFLAAEQVDAACDNWLAGVDPRFSRRLGRVGFIGMTIPAEYQGHGRSALERYVVIEELLAAGAPVGVRWVADRQTAQLQRLSRRAWAWRDEHGSEEEWAIRLGRIVAANGADTLWTNLTAGG